mmetsp:Transcript_68438/g.189541  ORF Transcript_68438/g.189541 Transcript_68438/m.189541 type:complete len:227 (-) Transcript_68438:236-916(-)
MVVYGLGKPRRRVSLVLALCDTHSTVSGRPMSPTAAAHTWLRATAARSRPSRPQWQRQRPWQRAGGGGSPKLRPAPQRGARPGGVAWDGGRHHASSNSSSSSSSRSMCSSASLMALPVRPPMPPPPASAACTGGPAVTSGLPLPKAVILAGAGALPSAPRRGPTARCGGLCAPLPMLPCEPPLPAHAVAPLSAPAGVEGSGAGSAPLRAALSSLPSLVPPDAFMLR